MYHDPDNSFLHDENLKAVCFIGSFGFHSSAGSCADNLTAVTDHLKRSYWSPSSGIHSAESACHALRATTSSSFVGLT